MRPRFVAHEPARAYGKAAVFGDLIFLSGEDSKHPTTGQVQGSTVSEQVEYLFQNMKETLESLGSAPEYVLKIVIYLKDPRDRPNYQEARRRYLPQDPASTLIAGVQLAEPDMLIEIDAIAAIPRD